MTLLSRLVKTDKSDGITQINHPHLKYVALRSVKLILCSLRYQNIDS
jgi:hypothetical protein